MTPYPCSYCGERFESADEFMSHVRWCDAVAKGLSEGSKPITSDGGLDAKAFLTEASEILLERGKTYDQEGGERSMERTVRAFNAISGLSLSEADGWLFMQTLKDVRQWTRDAYHHDSALDGICYSVLKAECLAKT